MSENKSWFESGYQGSDREAEKRELGGGPKRWWMASGASKQIVFVDDNPVCFDEHQWKTEGSKFPSFGTCISKTSTEACAGCSSKGVQKADYTGHLTIIDIDGYTTKDGKSVKFELVEFAPKIKAMQKLKARKQNKGTLIDQLYIVNRADENAPNSGDDFDHVRKANMEALYSVVTYRGKNLSELITKANGTSDESRKVRKYLAHHFQVPETGDIPETIPVLNYMTLHAPMDPADFRRAVVGAVSYAARGVTGGTGGAPGGTSSDDSVPF